MQESLKRAIREIFRRPTPNQIVCAFREKLPFSLITTLKYTRKPLVYYIPSYPYTDLRVLSNFGLDVKNVKNYMDEFNMHVKYPKNPHHYPLIYALAKSINAKTIVETGVGMGCSTYTFLLSLDIKGRLYSIDVKKDVGQMVPSHLREKWRLFVGDSLVILPKLLDSLGEIDIFFHDSVHTKVHQLLEYSIAWKHLRSGGLLISDDVTEALPIFSRIVKSKATVFGNRLGVMRKQVC